MLTTFSAVRPAFGRDLLIDRPYIKGGYPISVKLSHFQPPHVDQLISMGVPVTETDTGPAFRFVAKGALAHRLKGIGVGAEIHARRGVFGERQVNRLLAQYDSEKIDAVTALILNPPESARRRRPKASSGLFDR
ncbi:MAG: hypothetical protein AB7P76_11800 [Candidatus Melainabacteria bacterium]